MNQRWTINFILTNGVALKIFSEAENAPDGLIAAVTFVRQFMGDDDGFRLIEIGDPVPAEDNQGIPVAFLE